MCDRKRSRDYQHTRRTVDPFFTLWKSAKHRAEDKMVGFHITPEDIKAVWPLDDCCPVLGIPLVRGAGFVQDGSATLDRVNPLWGYEPDNLAVMSLRANRAKGNMQAHELEAIAVWMRHHGLD